MVVALNPALDLTYEVDQLRPGATNRVATMHSRVGGKAINVARVLVALGAEVSVVGLAAGDLARRLEEETAGALPAHWVALPGEARRTVAIVDRHSCLVTSVNEAGPVATPASWRELLGLLSAQLPAEAVVLSGSLAPGLPADAYAQVVRMARDSGAFVALDTDGPGFVPAVLEGPDLVKPNAAELACMGCGTVGRSVWAARDAAVRLRATGARAVVVSLGRQGLVASTPQGRWAACPPEIIGGNPTGAGDAAVAALVLGALEQRSWPERLRWAAALGAAAALESTAGAFDASRFPDLLLNTAVKEI